MAEALPAHGYAEGIALAALLQVIQSLPAGASELACHPATSVDFDSMYSEEQVSELRILTDPRVRHVFLESGIALISFADLPLQI